MFALRTLRSWRTPLALAGIGTIGFALGTWNGRPTSALAQTPAGPVIGAGAPVKASDYSQRIVARIYGNEDISREDLGEFLIARHGYQTLETLVNRRIIDHACKLKNIVITDADVEAALDEDLKPMNIDRPTFIKHVLKQRGKTLFEWKEDVIRPGLQLKALCREGINVEEAEIHKAFDARFGEKVRCRLIIWPEKEFRVAQRLWEEIRKSEAAFIEAATHQPNAQLASVGGQIDSIGRGIAKDDLIEKIAFRLKEGEVSELFPLTRGAAKDEGTIAVLRCEGRIPPDPKITFEKVHDDLAKEVMNQKVAEAVPALIKKLREEAKAEMFMPYVNHNPLAQRTKEEEEKLLKEEDKPVVPLPNQQPKPNK